MSNKQPRDILARISFWPFYLIFEDIYSEKLEIEGIQRNVQSFRPRFTFYPGFLHVTGDIFLNEKLMTEEMEKARKYVFLHEEGHRRDGIIGRIGETGEMIFLTLPGLLLGFLLISAGLISYLNIANLIMNPLSAIYYILSVFLIISFFSHLSEFRTEFFVLDTIGLDGYNEGRKNLRDEWSYSAVNQLIMLPAHPPKWMIFKSYRFLYQPKS